MTVNVNIGTYRQVATLSAYPTPITPATAVPDGDGSYTQTPVALNPPEWRCAIERATATTAVRHFSATIIAQASHVLSGRFHSGITTQTRVVWVDRAGTTHTANVLGVEDVEGAGVVSIVLVSEVTP